MMGRALLGGILGGVAMWVVGFIFWGTPLNRLALSVAPDAANAAVQSTLAQQLGPTGTGVYAVPWPGTQVGSGLYAQGPVAMVHFNASGFPVVDGSSLIGGLILAIIAAVLIAFAIHRVAAGLSFGRRLTLIGLFAIAIPAYLDLGQIVFNHGPSDYFIYSFVCDVLSFLAAGAVIAWMLPRPAAPLTE
ncbi:hypothetical protein LZK98_07750 [Sphingomonas cannabina]|uniref:hypothetical protein n=1 Tax=Sphingomonas cannabina TaxID=2899123 RepID=UPI001F29D9FA|nr:hypothetical protein [Sphingomonas cannabina]UIJ46826.1 hypothetical protein LZK98_07750 [Sphingomonas cannabina]